MKFIRIIREKPPKLSIAVTHQKMKQSNLNFTSVFQIDKNKPTERFWPEIFVSRSYLKNKNRGDGGWVNYYSVQVGNKG